MEDDAVGPMREHPDEPAQYDEYDDGNEEDPTGISRIGRGPAAHGTPAPTETVSCHMA